MLTTSQIPLCASFRVPFADFARLTDAFQTVADCVVYNTRRGRFTFADTLAADAATLYRMAVVAAYDFYANSPHFLAEMPHEESEYLSGTFRKYASWYADYNPVKAQHTDNADYHAAKAAYLHAGGTF